MPPPGTTFDGNPFTQLTFLNVIEELRIGGVIVNPGGIVGPPSSNDRAIVLFDGTDGEQAQDSVSHRDSDGRLTLGSNTPRSLSTDYAIDLNTRTDWALFLPAVTTNQRDQLDVDNGAVIFNVSNDAIKGQEV